MAKTPPAAFAELRVAAAPPTTDGLLEVVRSVLAAWRGVAEARLTLVALETRRAGLTITTMVGMAVAAACLLVATWLLAFALALYWAIGTGVSWSAAGVCLLGVNLLVVSALIATIRSVSRGLLFSATRRSLDPATPIDTAPVTDRE